MSRHTYKQWSKGCYSPDFHSSLSPRTKELTGYKCVICGERAKITHHAWYTTNGAGDTPGVNLFPLCLSHHQLAHSRDNWVRSGGDPVTGRRNTPRFIQMCNRGWVFYTAEVSRRVPRSKRVGGILRPTWSPGSVTPHRVSPTKKHPASKTGVFSWDRLFSRVDPRLKPEL